MTRTRHIFLQLCTGGDLFTYLINHIRPRGHLIEGEAKYLVYQLFQALSYLHDKNIAHRGSLTPFPSRWY